MADVKVHHGKVNRREGDPFADVVWIDGPKHRIQVYVSPAGRSIQVHVNGVKWEAPSGQ